MLRSNAEDEPQINALDDWTKDLLSSTRLPDVGIHEPEFHIEGIAPHLKIKSSHTGYLI